MTIDALVKAFPTAIPGAQYVDKHLLRNTDYLIIYIRQIHRVYEMDEHIYEELHKSFPEQADRMRDFSKRAAQGQDIDLMHRVQADIYRILDYLITQYGIDKVFVEGVSPELAKSYEMLPDLDRNTQDNAYIGFLLEGRLKIMAAETVESNSLGVAYAELGHSDSTQTMDDREAQSINMIAAQGDRLSVVIYGARHDFLPDVKTWNKAKGNEKKYSLIVITPENYPETRNKGFLYAVQRLFSSG